MLTHVCEDWNATSSREAPKARKEKPMQSMWKAVSDLDYYGQFNPEPPDDEIDDEPEDPFEVPMESEAA
jgi:hypothetical protein